LGEQQGGVVQAKECGPMRILFVISCLLVAFGCGDSEGEANATDTSPLGDSCFLGDEAVVGFNSYALTEVALVQNPLDCGDSPVAYCMGYHFQGRITCPYGQTQQEIDTLPGDDPARCRMADLEGNVTSVASDFPADPQLVERRAEDVVYCTCQCEGGDPSIDYCACPSGWECLNPYDTPGFLAKYCVRPGSEYDRTMPPSGVCEKTGSDPATDCGNGRRNP
jgi:hypothetical protein